MYRARDNDNESVVSSVLSRQDGFQGFSMVGGKTNSNYDSASDVSRSTTKSPKSVKIKKTYSSNNSITSQNVTAAASAAAAAKMGRVRVGVRCRPPFQDEIDNIKDPYYSIINTTAQIPNQNALGCVSLTMPNGKSRDFQYDYVFGQSSTQDLVYDTIAKPVVSDVLKGFNGTIFAYGQTGTGKTYTMGILEFIDNEHAGIVPRAIAQIFDYVSKQNETDIVVTLSFLQIYRESIQDLLAPGNTSPSNPSNSTLDTYNNTYASHTAYEDTNLAIREDPHRGFYVEGLQEYAVRNYHEAEALVNLGLENRAIAPTLMNATSSR